MLASSDTLRTLLGIGGAGIIAMTTAQAQSGQIIETNQSLPGKGFSVKPPPTPRSAAFAEVRDAEADAVLLPIGPDDVVGVGDTNPMINGRVHDWSAASDLDGAWLSLADGSMLWTYLIESPNAAGLRVRFEPFTPVRGSELVIYNADNAADAAGPYTSREAQADIPLWSARVFGRRARVEWFVPAEVVKAGEFGRISISGVLQVFPEPAAATRGGSCRIDARCHPEWFETGKSVAHYDFVQGSDGFICTGAMVTRGPVEDFCPLFLTAGHCIETQASASSMNIYWFFDSPFCDGPAPSLGGLPRTDGALLLKRNEDADTCLLGLPVDDIPSGIVWAGWSSAEAPDPTAATLIHHPQGLRKSWSPGNLVGIEDVSQCVFLGPTDTYDFELTNGGQDGGSSGGPVFDNANRRIRAVATCSTTDDCDPTEDTGEGSLHHGYPTLSPYLVASADVYVRNGWLGGENGTITFPFSTLREGWYAVRGGGTLHLIAGASFNGPFTFQGPRGMRLVAEGGPVRIGD